MTIIVNQAIREAIRIDESFCEEEVIETRCFWKIQKRKWTQGGTKLNEFM